MGTRSRMTSLTTIIFGKNYIINAFLLFLCITGFIYYFQVISTRSKNNKINSYNENKFDELENDAFAESQINNNENLILERKKAKLVEYKHIDRESALKELTGNDLDAFNNNNEDDNALHITESVQSENAGKETSKTFNEIWIWADKQITRSSLTPENNGGVDVVLNALATAPIVSLDILDIGDYESGTSQKWIAYLEGGQKAVIKIVWNEDERGKQKQEGACNYGFELPTSEIAAFHLHRILGFQNTPYVTGRRVKLSELKKVASPQVAKQFYTIDSDNGSKSTCLKGTCYYCKGETSICPPNDIIEVSVAYWVPRHLKMHTFAPKYMPYSTTRSDEWAQYGFNNNTYCNKVKTMEPYSKPWYYNDLFDFSVLDTLMHHYDSKHYTIDDHSSAQGLTVRLDHGRTFCSYEKDEYEIFLAPIKQCCTLRARTWNVIHTFQPGDLSRKLRESLHSDPLYPILVEDWYDVLERRLSKIIDVVNQCATANKALEIVLVTDG